MRWDASGTTATELGDLGTNGGYAEAYAVNDAGTAVGHSYKYAGDIWMGDHAVIWLPDASAIDLNNLGVTPVPAGGTWTLTSAKALSADGWAAGEGTFDPDGGGPLASYGRLWVAQVGLGGNWTKAAGGTWGRGPNWSTGTPAMQVGDAVFNVSAAYTVALDRNETTKSMALSAGAVSLDLSGHALTLENSLSIAAGATLSLSGTSGAFQVTGSVANAGTFEVGAGKNVVILGSLTGSGDTFVDGCLTVTSLSQNSLSIGGGPQALSVPEPNTVSLLLFEMGIVLIYLRRQRKSQCSGSKR